MTAVRRVVHGSVAAWVRLCIGILTQLISVPIYLRSWDGDTLGVWMSLQAMISLTQIVDVSHQNFLDGEFLKVGFTDRTKLFQIFSNSIAVAISLASVQFLFVIVASYLGWFSLLAGVQPNDLRNVYACNIFLIGSSFTWLLMGAVGGIAVRLVVPLGYYARMAWWGVAVSAVAFITTLPVALSGGQLIHVVLAYLISNFVVFLFLCFDLRRILVKEAVSLSKPRWKSGIANLGLSLFTLVQSFSEYLRQQGVRLMLGPFTGSSSVASFSSTRTGANVALQGMGTITGPILPELMRYAAKNEQSKIEGAFASIWLILMLVLLPSVIILQLGAESLFALWTIGKVDFDPFLFAVFSSTVLVYAGSQPAVALVRGNNLIRTQLLTSVLTTSSIVGLMFPLIGWFGVRGAAVALWIGECVAASILVLAASNWMSAKGLRWPWFGFQLVVANVAIISILLIYISAVKDINTSIVIMLSAAMLAVCFVYCKSLPAIVQQKLQRACLFWNQE